MAEPAIPKVNENSAKMIEGKLPEVFERLSTFR